jgi:hypothetical protein
MWQDYTIYRTVFKIRGGVFMYAKVYGETTCGINGEQIIVEVDISNGLPSFDIVGLPDTSVKESRERVRAALKNSGLIFPMTRITVNLAPADLKNLISTIKDNQVKYVFFETLVSPRIAQTVAEASGAETLVLDPLEGLSEAGRNNGDDYLKIMTRNIDNLELALGVK